jgi:hypothetical protein
MRELLWFLVMGLPCTLPTQKPAGRPAQAKPKYMFPADRDGAVVAVSRTVLTQVLAGKVDNALIAPPLRPQFTPGKVKTLRVQLKEFGPLKSVKLVDRKAKDEKDEGDVATLKITLGDTVFIGTMTVTKDNRLETFLLLEE